MASKQAQRLAARQQLQQRMSVKAEEERRKRTVLWSIGGVAGLAALILLAVGAVKYFAPEDEAALDAGPDMAQLLADAEAASTRCDGAEPSGEGETGEAVADLADGRPVVDVYLECFQLSTPDASATKHCLYNSVDGTSPVPSPVQPAAGTQEMTIVTNLGTITADISTEYAGCTAGAFTMLAQDGYFDGQQCHRLTTEGIWVLQCGDPDARAAIEGGTPEMAGMGSPGFQYAEENLPVQAEGNYPAGTLAMANAGAGSTGSQFFIVYEETTLPASYTILGQVTSGLEIVEEVAAAGVM